MAAPKFYSKLYAEKDQETNVRDKKIIEALIKRLNERLQNDPEGPKKAALILEQWLRKKN